MNPFLIATKRSIDRHGISIQYITVGNTQYNSSTGEVTNTETITTLKSYPRSITTNQYNYPNLIDKVVKQFYVYGPDLASIPKSEDRIKVGSDEYSIDSYKEYIANGQVVLYKIIAVKA